MQVTFNPKPDSLVALAATCLEISIKSKRLKSPASRAENAQRYIGVLSAVNKSSCQCKNGATFDAFCWVQLQRLQLLCCAGYYNRDNRLGEVRP